MRPFYILFFWLCVTTAFSQPGLPTDVVLNPALPSVLDACEGRFVTMATVSSPNATTLHYTLLLNDPRTTIWKKSVALTGGFPQSVPLELTQLQPDTQYLIALEVTDRNETLLSQNYVTLITAPCNVSTYFPVISSAEPKVEVCKNLPTSMVKINRARLPQARRLQYSIFINDPRTRVWQASMDLRAYPTNPPLVTDHPFGLPQLQSNTQYLAEVNIFDGNQNLIEQRYSTFITAPCSRSTPRLIRPEENTTIEDTRYQTSLVFEYLPAEGLDNPVRKIHIKLFKSDPRELLYENSKTFATAADAFKRNYEGIRKYTVGIEPGKQYVLELTTETATGERVNQNSYTFSTPAAPLIVEWIDLTKPVYLCPDPADSLLSIGGKLSISPGNYKARKLKLKITDAAGTIVSGGPWPPYKKGEMEIELDEYDIYDTDLTYGIFSSPDHNGDTLSARKLTIRIEDAQGHVLDSLIHPIQIIRLKLNRLPFTPEFVSPRNGDINVSTKPIISFRYPPFPSDNPSACHQYVNYTTIEIDRYPADWKNPDYQQGRYPSADWRVYFDLQPNTTYEARATYHVTTGRTYFDDVWDGIDRRVTMVFTTGPRSSARQLYTAQTGENETIAYPVPFHETLSVQVHSHYQCPVVHLIDQNGRTVYTRTAVAGKPIQLDTHRLGSGLYLLRIVDSTGNTEQMKIIKQ